MAGEGDGGLGGNATGAGLVLAENTGMVLLPWQNLSAKQSAEGGVLSEPRINSSLTFRLNLRETLMKPTLTDAFNRDLGHKRHMNGFVDLDNKKERQFWQ